jgi:hypothetical protein
MSFVRVVDRLPWVGSSAVIALIGLLSSSCAILRVGPAVEIVEVNPEEDAEKNLDAVRAMQADRYRRAPAETSPPAAPAISLQSSSPIEHSAPDQVPAVPSPGNRSVHTMSRGLEKRSPLSPLIDGSSLPDRSVPAYTIPSPVGPHQGSAERCVPDGLGGQRCLTR